ncbi:reverse transcriptase domain-containing protein [Acinetobacter guillouiae]
MDYLTQLKACSSQKDFANLLGYSEKTFTHILFSEDIHKKYNQFTIPKKGGGVRTILAPKPDLKILQARISLVLTECYEELEKKRLTTFSYVECITSHGFRRKFDLVIPSSKTNRKPLKIEKIALGIYSNAKRHTNKKYILNIDLENFFESITFSRIVGFFTKNKHFLLNYDIAILLAQIATYRLTKSTEAYLPQGSPCSPIISNLIGNILDIKMLNLAKKYKCTYTRYADDLTLSTNMKELPSELVTLDGNHWIAGKELKALIKSCKFKINDKKTRVNNRDFRQEVTSLTVNKKVNINKSYYRYTRSMVNEFCTKGNFYKSKFHMEPQKNTPQALNGILNYIFNIKKYNSFELDLKVKEFDDLDSIEKLYIRYLFHYYFIYPQRTIIIGEGYTDPLHLKLAFHKLYNNSISHIKFSSLQSTKKFSELLGFSGGTGLLQKFLKCYGRINKATVVDLSACIILIDGDSAGDSVIKTASSEFKNSINLINSSISTNGIPIFDFYHVFNNLYILQLPKNIVVEDLYDPILLASNIAGRTYNSSNKKFDLTKFYGKKDLFEKIVFPNQDTIDFSNFKIIFNTIFHIQLYHYLYSLSVKNI